MRRTLGVLAITLILVGAAPLPALAQKNSAPERPVLVQVDGLAPMLLFGESPAKAATAHVDALGENRVFPGKQRALEGWARGRFGRPVSTSLARLRAGSKPIIGVQLNNAGSMLGGEHLTPRMRAIVSGIRKAGGEPLLLPPAYQAKKIPKLLDAVDHLILPGGDDVDPSLYGEAVTFANKSELNQRRDKYEKMMILRARRRGVPIVGICRGCQLLNVASGGTLYQDINKEGVTGEKHTGTDYDRKDHDVKVEPGSRMARTFGATLVKSVASLHHSAVKTPGKGIVIVGRSPDGVVEAIESKDRKARGYQFHPEMDPAYRKALFRDVIAEAKKTASYRKRREGINGASGGSSLLRTRSQRTTKPDHRRPSIRKAPRQSPKKFKRARTGRR